MTLNVTVSDARTGIASVTFNVINAATGVVNDTIIGIEEGANQYSANFNLSHYPDGTYNITFMVYDTAGNYNFTANGTTYAANSILTNIIIDNTRPTVTAACSPTNVDVGDAFPCSCTSSDATSGINSTSTTSTSPDGTGSIVNTGSFTYTCSVVDRAGNTQASNVNYVVDSGSSSSSSSGSSSSSSSSSGSTGSTGASSGSSASDPSTGSSTGSAGASSGSGASGQGQGSESAGVIGGLSMGWIIAIIVIAAIVVGIIVMVKRRN